MNYNISNYNLDGMYNTSILSEKVLLKKGILGSMI
jgi:hypothetical protein